MLSGLLRKKISERDKVSFFLRFLGLVVLLYGYSGVLHLGNLHGGSDDT